MPSTATRTMTPPRALTAAAGAFVLACTLPALAPPSAAATPAAAVRTAADAPAEATTDAVAGSRADGSADGGRVSVSVLERGRGGTPHARTTAAMPVPAALALVASLRRTPGVLAAGLTATMRRSATTDPLAARQWGLTAVGAGSAWRYTRGQGVLVAVVDAGVDVSHPDLKAALVPGYHVFSGTSAVSPDPHGTHVAGIIAATASNGVGGRGLAPRVRLMPIDVFRDGPGAAVTSDAAVAQGIVVAARRGARVINLSLGGPVGTPVLRRAVEYAQARGAVVVAAAGNDGTSVREFPASYAGVVGVGAVDARLRRAWFSNVGPSVDLVAPGVSILSTCAIGSDVCPTSRYVAMSGTSMAAPFVAAAAALIRARFPAWPSSRVVAELERTASDLGPRGVDASFGHGLVRPGVVLAGTPGTPLVTGVVAKPGARTVTVTWKAPGVSGGYGVARYRVQLSLDGGRTWPTTVFSADGRSRARLLRSVPRERLVRVRVAAVAGRTGVVGSSSLSARVWTGFDAPDDLHAPTSIALGASATDVSAGQDDADWWSVTVPAGADPLDPVAVRLEVHAGQSTQRVIVLDAAGQQVTATMMAGPSFAPYTWLASPGTYRIGIVAVGPVDTALPYRVRVAAVSP